MARLGTFRRIGGDVTPLHEGDEVEARIRIRPAYVSDWLPTIGELTSLDLDYTDGRTQLRDVRYNQATSSALVVGGVRPTRRLRPHSVLTPDRLHGRRRDRPPTEAQRQPEGAFLDPYLRALRGRRRPTPRAGAAPRPLPAPERCRTHSPARRRRQSIDLGAAASGLGSHQRHPVPVQRRDGTRRLAPRRPGAGRGRAPSPTPDGTIAQRRRHVVGRAPVRRRNLAHPRTDAATPGCTPRSRTRTSRSTSQGGSVRRSRPSATRTSRSPRVPTSQLPEGTVIEEHERPVGGRSVLVRRRRPAASPPCVDVRPAGEGPASWRSSEGVLLVGGVRQRLAGGARRCSRPRDTGPGRAGAGSPRPSGSAWASTWPGRPTRPSSHRCAASADGGPRVLGRDPAAARAGCSPRPGPVSGSGRSSTRVRCSRAGSDAGRPGAQVSDRSATKIAVPGVSSPRARDQPPHTRSWDSGHSGSTRSCRLKPRRASSRTQSPSVRWCST